jgi:Dolichyl-phosphate-mannose-protein mannosyltransferase
MELCREQHLYLGPSLRPLTILLKWLSRSDAVPALFVFYMLPRAALLLLAVNPTSDAGWYFDRAVALTAGDGYSEGGVPTAFWPPGWPMTLAVLFKLFGPSLFVAQIFNLACSAGVAWFTLDLGRRLFNSEIAGRVGLLLLAIYPNHIGYVPLVMTEVFYTVLLLAGCWLLVVYRSTATRIFAGLVFGLATLVKAQSMLVIPIIFGIETLRGQSELKTAIRALINATFVIAIAFIVVLPWSYRNYRTFGEWILVSTNGGLTLLTGNNPSARGDYTQNDPLVTSIKRTVATQLLTDTEAQRRALQWIKENPGRFVALMPLKLFRLWAPDGESEWAFQAGYKGYDAESFWFRAVRYVNQVYYVCLLVGFAWAGLILFGEKIKFYRKPIDWWALPYALALYPTAIALVFSGQSRFHYPIMPFVAMSCGWLLVFIARTTQKNLCNVASVDTALNSVRTENPATISTQVVEISRK